MDDALLFAFGRGALLSGSLIMAIGAQNAFVLRQGLQRVNVLPVVLTCALCDAVLITAGIGGAGALITSRPSVLVVLSWLGAGYLVWFGLKALGRAVKGTSALAPGNAQQRSVGRVIATTAALTLLNPHVYLDTLVLLGALGAREVGAGRVAFGVGAIVASLSWFFGLGFGARLLTPVFARPVSWRVLDTVIGVMVLGIAGSLVW